MTKAWNITPGVIIEYSIELQLRRQAGGALHGRYVVIAVDEPSEQPVDDYTFADGCNLRDILKIYEVKLLVLGEGYFGPATASWSRWNEAR